MPSFEDDLRLAALTEDRDDAYAGIHRIAQAAGLDATGSGHTSIGEVCDEIAAWCTQHRAHDRAHGHARTAGLSDADLHGPAAALKAALVTNPLSPPADVFTTILTFAARQNAEGGQMWRLRCSADIAQAHRLPGLSVDVMRDWLSRRWELADGGGALIATSGHVTP